MDTASDRTIKLETAGLTLDESAVMTATLQAEGGESLVTRGGSIGFISAPGNLSLNLVNCHDMGREIQLSYYSGPNVYNPPTAAFPVIARPLHHTEPPPVAMNRRAAFQLTIEK